MKTSLILLMSLTLCGCTTTAKNYKLIDGELTCVQKLEIKGLGDREANFEDKSKIKSDATRILPDMDIDIDKLKD